ncbi:putative transcriptional regulatory protein [Candidatus Kinetoplastibacterium sorsogonicusi]|uniref:Probable transcriptional regulatory protein CKSOR_00201 n=1 Tax=Candidatus Kinetoplastidibacterium kentomonadis TaxID=1576550 RepID=A0A3S7J9I1_9PROT|nr:YebC/PmpR family DNA-binding transcriptional regulator [Candidatus Kinetoplastibacterium sorsogonicusi]AWD32325.1 putative transcriptional regulatory protein [Candidatus Kinetoplastibacterium sorsogonicusi]
MAGHSKWANIQHRKNRQDSKKGKLWTKLIREITIAAREGGKDINNNSKLRIACEKANNVNMPKDNIQRAIKRGIDNTQMDYIEARYEGYGISGSAIIVDTMTDNKIRTTSEVRSIFNKYQGHLGQEGSVSFLFNYCGQIVFSPNIIENADIENKIIDIALFHDAEDIIVDDDGFIEIICAPKKYSELHLDFKNLGLKTEIECLTMKPINEIRLNDNDLIKFKEMIENLQALDDIKEVYSNVIF